MGTRDKRIDAYIARSAEFARPILSHLREVVHTACPEVEETIKWGHPSFSYHGILCGFAAFKEHASFGLWKHGLIMATAGVNREAMGQFGRLTTLKDLPGKRVLNQYIKAGMQLNEAGVKAPRKTSAPRGEPAVPPDFNVGLANNARAKATFASFPAGQRREYIDWITEAKQEATRARRISTAIEWLAEGKRRNWKYENC